MSERVQSDSAVLVHFTLTLADGSTAESSLERGKPVLFRLGDGSLSPALERQLLGLSRGDRRQFTLEPEAAFGPVNPDLIQFFLRRDFSRTGVPDVGTIMVFSGAAGHEMPGVIRAVEQESVTVDFNHPLAGQTVTFNLEVLDIDPQQEEQHANLAG
ncbi:FKBP-type peptidyl-prolyl cis-trans isomerase [Affinibrenneria salicis]|uniref:Peptidyl-prolyl cis-trans isomerase n=1 Tax=Affinibrenneria salicis TaxID=2590031 RepID=A0A5J5G711_9GAMM|nr:FKBP-type peptidyl-prolyl cis-trans isomerase [Affinibrenneria salicis]KAA9002665.1 FKBP-type peptidyl-prolyl cis-trans isomerase [Affinibrenneria salicis]KAA9003048.1 FKBP-type peptidyl-prolyl cis-trans isomerase [Affinibrenneria salicis]